MPAPAMGGSPTQSFGLSVGRVSSSTFLAIVDPLSFAQGPFDLRPFPTPWEGPRSCFPWGHVPESYSGVCDGDR